MEKKYEMLKDNALEYDGKAFYRIRALRFFNDVKIGDLGGYVENEENLSHEGNCWLYDNARIFDNGYVGDNATAHGHCSIMHDSKLYGNAKISGKVTLLDHASVFDNAEIFDKSAVFDYAKVYGDAKVSGGVCITNDTEICLDAHIKSIKDYIIIQNIGSALYPYTFFRLSDGDIGYACFKDNGSLDQFIKRNKNSKYSDEYSLMADLVKLRFSRV